MNKILKYVIVSLLLLALFTTIGVFFFLRSSFATKLQFQGKDISISRDDHNIPEIHAQSFRSALYAWGYVTAEDRLFQLAFRRASVKGQLSQYLGQKAIDVDKMLREINLHGWATRSAERFYKQNVTQYNNFKAYAQGINDYYDSLTFQPLEFYMTGLKWEDWTVADIFGMYKLIKWSLSFGMVEEYIRSSLLKNYTKQQVDKFLPHETEQWIKGQHATQKTIVRDNEIPNNILQKSLDINFQSFKPIQVQEMIKIGYFQYLDINERASNSWVISGKLTDTGHPLLCNDPHLDSALPGEWHQVKVFYQGNNGEQLYIIGGAIVGLPTVVGKTTYVSVTMTTNYIDSQDLFKQQIEGDKYFLDGQWKPLKIRKQIIKVKGKNPIQYNVLQTHRGPIMKHIGLKGNLYKIDQPVSLSWVGFTDAQHHSLSRYVRLAEVKQFDQLRKMLTQYTDYGPPLNLVYSTRDNHIGYQAMGVIPIRRSPQSGMYVKDGTTSKSDWIGFVRGEDQLHLEDPERGFIVTANNKAASQKYYGGILQSTMYTARANRIEQLIQDQIKSGRKLSKDFMRKIQLDTVDSFCLQIVKGMKQRVRQDNPTHKFVFSLFENFDCNFTAQATTPSYYLTFFQNLYLQLHPQGHNSTFNLANFGGFHQYLYNFLLKPHSPEQLKQLNASLFSALKQLRTFFHSDNPSAHKYGILHRDLMIHRPFSYVPFLKRFFEKQGPGFGNFNTPNVAHMNRFHEKDYRTNHRANIRVIMSYYEDSQWIVDGGTNEKVYSRHYSDQHDMFMQGKYLLMDQWNRTNYVQ